MRQRGDRRSCGRRARDSLVHELNLPGSYLHLILHRARGLALSTRAPRLCPLGGGVFRCGDARLLPAGAAQNDLAHVFARVLIQKVSNLLGSCDREA